MEGAGDFTFAVAAPLAGAGDRRVGAGLLYPVFGQPRSPPRQRALETETTTATVRVPLGRFLLVDRGLAGVEQQPDGGDKPAKTCYCSWCPGSPAAVAASSPARCRKSGSTGSVLRWSQRLLGRSHSDGKEKFVFLDASPSNSGSKRKGVRSGGTDGAGGLGGHAAHVWSSYAHKGGGNDRRRRSFLPYRQDLVGLFASATAFRRSYHPF